LTPPFERGGVTTHEMLVVVCPDFSRKGGRDEVGEKSILKRKIGIRDLKHITRQCGRC